MHAYAHLLKSSLFIDLQCFRCRKIYLFPPSFSVHSTIMAFLPPFVALEMFIPYLEWNARETSSFLFFVYCIKIYDECKLPVI